MRSSTAGRLLDRVLDLEFDLKHFRMSRDEVSCEERDALKTLEHERGKWEQEESRRMMEEREIESKVQAMQSRRR